ncbi:MAG TPA: efflux RND transporter permease subunit [Thermoanaerobaculia bacterium]|nr:efflux RND transporter permease subunit [Thermoanaerobaculia bacterium]
MPNRLSLRALLARLATLTVRHPVAVLVAVAAPAILGGAGALRTPVDLSFTGVLDRSNPEVERYFRAARRFGLGGALLVLLEGDEAELSSARAVVAGALATLPEIGSVEPETDPEWWLQQAPWLVDDGVFDDWLSLAAGTPAPDAADRLAAALGGSHSRRVEGARLIEARLAQDPLDALVGEWPFLAIERAVRSALAASHPDVDVSFSGLPAIAAQDQARTLSTIKVLTPVSLLLVLLIFRRVERRPLGLLAVATPLLLAVAATLGVVGAITGELTLMETFFGVTVFGLGIDFAIHLLVRLREERSRGQGFHDALQATLVGTGRGVVSGAVTTAGAFMIAALAPDPVARHLGLAGGIGLLCSLVLMLVMLPALWWLLEGRRGRSPHERRRAWSGAAGAPSPASLGALAAIAGHAVRHPGTHLALATAALAAAAFGLPRLAFETDLTRVFNRHVPAVETVQRVSELFGLNGAPWIASAPSLESARARSARFRAAPGFTRVLSVADLIPSPERVAQRGPRLAAAAPAARARLGLLATLEGADEATISSRLALAGAMAPEGTTPSVALAQGRKALAALIAAQDAGPPSLGELPPALRRALVGRDGELLVLAYAGGSSLDAELAREQRLRAQAIAPDATSVSALLEAVMLGDRPWLLPVALGILAFVVLVLLVDFRSVRWMTLALLPVLVGSGLTLGLFCWLGLSFNVMTAIVLPLLVGLGVDDGIHVVHRIREQLASAGGEERTAAIPHAAAAVARAITLTTLTTCASFAALLFTDHPGLESMALVMLIGLPICLLASVSTLPAAATLLLARTIRPGR